MPPPGPLPPRTPPATSRLYWLSLVTVATAVVTLAVNLTSSVPYLWPAGSGVLVVGEPHLVGAWGPNRSILPRPPRSASGATQVREVAPASAAAVGGVQPGDVVTSRALDGGNQVTFDHAPDAPVSEWLPVWRAAQKLGPTATLGIRSGPRDAAQAAGVRRVRPAPVWSASETVIGQWVARYVGLVAQVVVFAACAIVLLAVRGDATAQLAALALALCAAANSGPPASLDPWLPQPLAGLFTTCAWLAAPLAFPAIALSLAYFPSVSPRLVAHPWLRVVPFVTAAPLMGGALASALYLAGVEGAGPAATFAAEHPGLSDASFGAAIVVNLIAMGEGLVRYRQQRDANERRRIRVSMATTVIGVSAFALKEGLVALLAAVGSPSPGLPAWLSVGLDLVVLLPAVGVTYAVTVHRVLGPRWFLRRSLQYALAARTLRWLPLASLVPLLLSAYLQRNRPLGAIVGGAPTAYLALVGVAAVGFLSRDRAREWLDRRFFRTEYDARTILTSLAGQLRFETDPSQLADLVVAQLDEALRPRSVALLVGGIETGAFVPVAVRHGSIESLQLDGPLAQALGGGSKPLHVTGRLDDGTDSRPSPDDREWLQCSGASLLVPVTGQGGTLIGILALGEKHSEEAYDREDETLLASVAAQVGLFLDVARLRDRVAESELRARALELGAPPPSLAICQQCGRADDPDVKVCDACGGRLEPVLSVPRVVEGRYHIEQRLGRGGMGEVFRATDIRLGRAVAIKVVRAERLLHSDAVSRFRREAHIVARLQHPAIVAVYDFGTMTDGTAFLAMELVRGRDLRDVLRRGSRMSTAEASRFLTPICAAISTAHLEGILHRDLKPENILVAEPQNEIKVVDFGIAKLLADADTEGETMMASTMTQAGSVMGTPAYMSPEQLRGEPLDARSDVFSLGVLAYEMLSGELPFGSASLADIAVRHRAPVASLVDRGVPEALDGAVRAALAYDREQRPPSAAAFAAHFASWEGATPPPR